MRKHDTKKTIAQVFGFLLFLPWAGFVIWLISETIGIKVFCAGTLFGLIAMAGAYLMFFYPTPEKEE